MDAPAAKQADKSAPRGIPEEAPLIRAPARITSAPLTISRADAFICDLAPARPRTDAVQSFTTQETIFVEVETIDGIVGLGYAYTIGTGGRAVLELLRRDLLPLVLGEDARRVEQIWSQLFWSTHATSVGPITNLALAAIDTALWDIRGIAADTPLWIMAGGSSDRARVYDTEGGWLQLTVDELVHEAQATVARGWDGFKMKVGKPSLSEDVERVAAVRGTLGPRVNLMVDANQAFTSAEALRLARRLEPFDVYWLEEPLPAEDITGHARLAASTSIPLAVGESIYSLSHFREYLAIAAAGFIQVDAARIGGITPWLKTAHLAEAFNVKVAPHFLMELHVSLAAAVPNGCFVEHIPQLDPLTHTGLEIVDGYALAPVQPGLGISWDRGAIERACVG
jgi:L-alanine-DL-glutamate epimerase-like enolase superfamily enzyme